MTSTRWDRLNSVFQDALALPADERAGFVRRTCADDPALAAEAALLIEAHSREEGLMEQPAIVGAGLWPTDEAPALAGHRFGPYRVLREIGRGGMGAVYLAERADGAFEQRVALKLIKRGMDSDRVLTRFRVERQILASLEHPNIARLLDGGASDDGQPFFVMEYIDGRRIDEYADALRLPAAARLRLWLQVAGAVSYAHQHLVVHRDLKPANILVTAEGTPKLLDFGIARLLDPNAEAAASLTEMRMLTPEYASPEQIEGRHATTASDVYSLGVVLYELLTGRSPYRARSRSAKDIAEAICTTEPVRPSLAAGETDAGLARRLRGDLDTILLTALRKEPARRYASVEQFAGDVLRHLDGLPVRARPDTFGYRAGKFVRRHRAGVAAAILAGLALVGGTVGIAWEARQARAAQARAERRFNDVRQLAHAVLFDYHEAIKDVAGTTPIQERLVRDGLRYLDTLAVEAQGDRSLQRELAAAYQRVGDVQAGSITANVGDTRGALESYRKAEHVLETLVAADSSDERSRRGLAVALVARAKLEADTGNVEGGLTLARRAESILAPMAAGPMDRELRLELGAADDLVGVLLLETGDPQGSVERHRTAIKRLEAAPSADQTNPALRRALSVAYQHLGNALAQIDGSAAALESLQRSRALRAGLVAEFRDNADYQHLLGSADYWIGMVLADIGRYQEALDRFRAMVGPDSVLAARDPRNAANQSSLAFDLLRVGDMQLRLGRPADALATYRRSLAMSATILAADSTNLGKRFQLLESQTDICRATAVLAPTGADQECERAARLMGGIELDPANAGYRGYLAGKYSDLAAVYDTLASQSGRTQRRARTALELYRQSSAIWSDLEARKLVNPTDTGRVSAARLAVARAERVVGQAGAAGP